MKKSEPGAYVSAAFTLIELLVVIAIIGVLAALIVSAFRLSKPKIAMAQAELGEMESAIQDYKDRLGFYPPDNPNNPVINPLWFELVGTTNNGLTYVTLDASGQISIADMNAKFGRQSFANSSTKAHGTDETGAPMSFLKNLRTPQVGELVSPNIKILVCSVRLPSVSPSSPISGSTLNPWRYISTNPMHNPGSYDLWVDLVIGGKTYRIGNWNKQPEVVP